MTCASERSCIHTNGTMWTRGLHSSGSGLGRFLRWKAKAFGLCGVWKNALSEHFDDCRMLFSLGKSLVSNKRTTILSQIQRLSFTSAGFLEGKWIKVILATYLTERTCRREMQKKMRYRAGDSFVLCRLLASCTTKWNFLHILHTLDSYSPHLTTLISFNVVPNTSWLAIDISGGQLEVMSVGGPVQLLPLREGG